MCCMRHIGDITFTYNKTDDILLSVAVTAMLFDANTNTSVHLKSTVYGLYNLNIDDNH